MTLNLSKLFLVCLYALLLFIYLVACGMWSVWLYLQGL